MSSLQVRCEIVARCSPLNPDILPITSLYANFKPAVPLSPKKYHAFQRSTTQKLTPHQQHHTGSLFAHTYTTSQALALKALHHAQFLCPFP